MADEMEREISFNADHKVTRYEADCRRSYERELAEQRLKIAHLEAEKISDEKDIEVYKQTRADLKEALAPIKEDIKCLQAKAAAQDVWNTAQQAALHRISDDVNDLLHLTRRYIPRRYIMPPIEDAPEP